MSYIGIPWAEEVYHQLVADLKDKFALSEERTYVSFRAVLYEFFRGRLIDDMRRRATAAKHGGGVERNHRRRAQRVGEGVGGGVRSSPSRRRGDIHRVMAMTDKEMLAS